VDLISLIMEAVRASETSVYFNGGISQKAIIVILAA
jgi:hypothetical protein